MQKTEISIVQWHDYQDILYKIRRIVFIEEQNVPPEIEIDLWDENSIHALARQEEKCIGTGRLLPDGHIGRVAVLKPYRGLGIGKEIMLKLIEIGMTEKCPDIRLSAQIHAIRFYEKLGFEMKGEMYLEAGIEHIDMVYSKKNATNA